MNRLQRLWLLRCQKIHKSNNNLLSYHCNPLIYQNHIWDQSIDDNNPLPEIGCVGGDDKKVCLWNELVGCKYMVEKMFFWKCFINLIYRLIRIEFGTPWILNFVHTSHFYFRNISCIYFNDVYHILCFWLQYKNIFRS